MAAATLSTAPERAIARSLALAREHGQQPGTLHLLAALLDEPDARDALAACAVDQGALRTALARSLAEATAPAAGLLAGLGVSRPDVALYLAHGTRKARP